MRSHIGVAAAMFSASKLPLCGRFLFGRLGQPAAPHLIVCALASCALFTATVPKQSGKPLVYTVDDKSAQHELCEELQVADHV